MLFCGKICDSWPWIGYYFIVFWLIWEYLLSTSLWYLLYQSKMSTLFVKFVHELGSQIRRFASVLKSEWIPKLFHENNHSLPPHNQQGFEFFFSFRDHAFLSTKRGVIFILRCKIFKFIGHENTSNMNGLYLFFWYLL